MSSELYDLYRTRMQGIADLRSASAVLQWDQETYLPKGGAHFRGQQISTLSELAHQLFTGESLGGLLHDLLAKDDLSPAQRRNLERTLEDYDKQKKYPSAFVRQLSEATNRAFHAWIEARRENSFARFEKELDTLIGLKKQEADLLGFSGHPYNALLDEYEKGATVTLLDTTFDGLLPALRSLLQQIREAPQVDDRFLQGDFPRAAQWDWGLWLLKELHFDFEHGRQDLSEHPFSTSFSPQDVRITTRVDERDFSNMTWSCIHEAGHALYEQGLPAEEYGLPLGEACSYSIHESQSRLWENNVGRSAAFWHHYFPAVQGRFPAAFGGLSAEQFFRGINKVQPSLVRTEADEITYHFHVYIRYALEKQLLEGSLSTADIPAFWNSLYKELLGVTVPDDRQGCLQDVHWSHGSFGYFSTYSLGSFYAAQFHAAAARALPLEEQLQAGETGPLLQWLRTNIHRKGRFHTSEALCLEVTGETLNVDYFVDYLLQKYARVYNLTVK